MLPPTGNPHWSKVGVAEPGQEPGLSGPGAKRQDRQRRRARAARDPGRVRRRPVDDEVAASRQRDGSVASQAMLGGLVRCAGCGHTLKITGNTDKRPASATRSTTAPAATPPASAPPAPRSAPRCSTATSKSKCWWRSRRRRAARPGRRRLRSRSRRPHAPSSDAEHELDLFVTNPKLLTLLGEQQFVEGVEARQHALDQARAGARRAAHANQRSPPNSPTATCSPPGRPSPPKRNAACCTACSNRSCCHARGSWPARKPDRRTHPDHSPRRHNPRPVKARPAHAGPWQLAFRRDSA